MDIFVSLHVKQIMAHGIICPLVYDWRNLDEQMDMLITRLQT
uniref:Uncharacterized protein n=1 Tax=Rhizophora mucronata TaxID=61149 RepID=A0A2P2M8R2_RHIMU